MTVNVRHLIDPSNGEALDEIADSSSADVDRAVANARSAFETWGRATPSERSKALLRLADLIEAEAESLCRLEVAETGKPWAVMAEGEMPFALDNLRFFAAAARGLDGTAAGEFSTGYTSMWFSG